MKLYHSPTTPFGRKVMVLIAVAGLQNRINIVTVSGTPLSPGSLPIDQNPLGKIPALEREDGSVIYDSRVICRYLDDLASAGMYPAGPQLWDVLTLEAMADGILDAAILMAYEVRIRPVDKQYPEWIEAQWAKIDRALDAIETGWIDHLNDACAMSHIAIGCALGYLDFRHDARNWRQGRPKLAKWSLAFAARPVMVATQPPAV